MLLKILLYLMERVNYSTRNRGDHKSSSPDSVGWACIHIWMVLAKCSFSHKTIIFSLKWSANPQGCKQETVSWPKLISPLYGKQSVWYEIFSVFFFLLGLVPDEVDACCIGRNHTVFMCFLVFIVYELLIRKKGLWTKCHIFFFSSFSITYVLRDW